MPRQPLIVASSVAADKAAGNTPSDTGTTIAPVMAGAMACWGYLDQQRYLRGNGTGHADTDQEAQKREGDPCAVGNHRQKAGRNRIQE